MHYLADLHVHSHYARATSKYLNLDTLYQWARIKGIHLIGTGDFTHPAWVQTLQDQLIPDGNGFYRLKHPPVAPALPGIKPAGLEVRFCLTAEVCTIYKHEKKVRKNHHLLFAPDMATVARINKRLSRIGNLAADGRPILGLSSRNLLEIVLEASPYAHLIPAHIWTPWFSTLGAQSGYDAVEDCFRDLSSHIFALETGLSSDPSMNWRVSSLDRYTLVSNSDAHSARNVGRELNVLDTCFSYTGLFEALQTKKGFLGTIEFFPEQGKYHLDGHRNCNVCCTPEETKAYQGKCPHCDKPLTIGVLHRVRALSDRIKPCQPKDAPGFRYGIPLMEIIAQLKQKGPLTKTVQQEFIHIISQFGSEHAFVHEAPLQDIERRLNALYAMAIRRIRTKEVHPEAGYDGKYGVIRFAKPKEPKVQASLF